jgi:ankyrin repeat protein
MGFDGDAKEAVVFLISRGADANAAGENGCPPLLYAMSLYCAFADDVGRSDAEAKQQRAIVAALLSAGANVNASSPRTGTAIYMAAFRLGDNELIDMLIKKGAHLKVPG